jgi:hypothetical protein
LPGIASVRLDAVVLSDARLPLRNLVVHLEQLDHRQRLAVLEDRLERASSPDRRAVLRLEILALDVPRRPDWVRRRWLAWKVAQVRPRRPAPCKLRG